MAADDEKLKSSLSHGTRRPAPASFTGRRRGAAPPRPAKRLKTPLVRGSTASRPRRYGFKGLKDHYEDRVDARFLPGATAER